MASARRRGWTWGPLEGIVVGNLFDLCLHSGLPGQTGELDGNRNREWDATWEAEVRKGYGETENRKGGGSKRGLGVNNSEWKVGSRNSEGIFEAGIRDSGAVIFEAGIRELGEQE